jgi:hypothetical protein
MIRELKITDKWFDSSKRPRHRVVIDISQAKKIYHEYIIAKAVKEFFCRPEAYLSDFLLKPRVFENTSYIGLNLKSTLICRFGDTYTLPGSRTIVPFDEIFKVEKKDLDLGNIDSLQENFMENEEIL